MVHLRANAAVKYAPTVTFICHKKSDWLSQTLDTIATLLCVKVSTTLQLTAFGIRLMPYCLYHSSSLNSIAEAYWFSLLLLPQQMAFLLQSIAESIEAWDIDGYVEGPSWGKGINAQQFALTLVQMQEKRIRASQAAQGTVSKAQ